MIQIDSIEVENRSSMIEAILELSQNFNDFCLLNSNTYADPYGRYELLVGVGCKRRIPLQELFNTKFSSIENWIFLHLSYDLKNRIEKLHSISRNTVGFEDLSAFVPEFLFQMEKGSSTLNIYSHSENDNGFSKYLRKHNSRGGIPKVRAFPKVRSRISKMEYLNKVKRIKEHIQRGNIYEANFCMEFFAEDAIISPMQAYMLLNSKSPAPFSAFYKQNDKYLISSSPERFMAKRSNKVISQPMKGTIKRSGNKQKDEELKTKLRHDPKEQTENVMIVDVSRNDLSRVAERASVKVEELFGIYTFPQVHQMVSTVSCNTGDDLSFGKLIEASFPMASMTGAPKISAMEILETEEENSRNLYSGSLGYISPGGDMDLSVVIRSLLYNSSKKYLSYSTGGAITAMSDAEKEYQECLLKAKAIFGL